MHTHSPSGLLLSSLPPGPRYAQVPKYYDPWSLRPLQLAGGGQKHQHYDCTREGLHACCLFYQSQSHKSTAQSNIALES